MTFVDGVNSAASESNGRTPPARRMQSDASRRRRRPQAIEMGGTEALREAPRHGGRGAIDLGVISRGDDTGDKHREAGRSEGVQARRSKMRRAGQQELRQATGATDSHWGHSSTRSADSDRFPVLERDGWLDRSLNNGEGGALSSIGDEGSTAVFSSPTTSRTSVSQRRRGAARSPNIPRTPIQRPSHPLPPLAASDNDNEGPVPPLPLDASKPRRVQRTRTTPPSVSPRGPRKNSSLNMHLLTQHSLHRSASDDTKAAYKGPRKSNETTSTASAVTVSNSGGPSEPDHDNNPAHSFAQSPVPRSKQQIRTPRLPSSSLAADSTDTQSERLPPTPVDEEKGGGDRSPNFQLTSVPSEMRLMRRRFAEGDFPKPPSSRRRNLGSSQSQRSRRSVASAQHTDGHQKRQHQRQLHADDTSGTSVPVTGKGQSAPPRARRNEAGASPPPRRSSMSDSSKRRARRMRRSASIRSKESMISAAVLTEEVHRLKEHLADLRCENERLKEEREKSRNTSQYQSPHMASPPSGIFSSGKMSSNSSPRTPAYRELMEPPSVRGRESSVVETRLQPNLEPSDDHLSRTLSEGTIMSDGSYGAGSTVANWGDSDEDSFPVGRHRGSPPSVSDVGSRLYQESDDVSRMTESVDPTLAHGSAAAAVALSKMQRQLGPGNQQHFQSGPDNFAHPMNHFQTESLRPSLDPTNMHAMHSPPPSVSSYQGAPSRSARTGQTRKPPMRSEMTYDDNGNPPRRRGELETVEPGEHPLENRRGRRQTHGDPRGPEPGRNQQSSPAAPTTSRPTLGRRNSSVQLLSRRESARFTYNDLKEEQKQKMVRQRTLSGNAGVFVHPRERQTPGKSRRNRRTSHRYFRDDENASDGETDHEPADSDFDEYEGKSLSHGRTSRSDANYFNDGGDYSVNQESQYGHYPPSVAVSELSINGASVEADRRRRGTTRQTSYSKLARTWTVRDGEEDSVHFHTAETPDQRVHRQTSDRRAQREGARLKSENGLQEKSLVNRDDQGSDQTEVKGNLFEQFGILSATSETLLDLDARCFDEGPRILDSFFLERADSLYSFPQNEDSNTARSDTAALAAFCFPDGLRIRVFPRVAIPGARKLGWIGKASDRWHFLALTNEHGVTRFGVAFVVREQYESSRMDEILIKLRMRQIRRLAASRIQRRWRVLWKRKQAEANAKRRKRKQRSYSTGVRNEDPNETDSKTVDSRGNRSLSLNLMGRSRKQRERSRGTTSRNDEDSRSGFATEGEELSLMSAPVGTASHGKASKELKRKSLFKRITNPRDLETASGNEFVPSSHTEALRRHKAVSSWARKRGSEAYKFMQNAADAGDVCVVEKCYVLTGGEGSELALLFAALRALVSEEKELSDAEARMNPSSHETCVSRLPSGEKIDADNGSGCRRRHQLLSMIQAKCRLSPRQAAISYPESELAHLNFVSPKYELRLGLTGYPRLTAPLPLPRVREQWGLAKLLLSVGHESVMLALRLLLLERSVLIVGASWQEVTACSATLIELLRPFEWPNTFMPVLPFSMLDFVCSPVPFVGGLAVEGPQKLSMVENDDRIMEAMTGGMSLLNLETGAMIITAEKGVAEMLSLCPFLRQTLGSLQARLYAISEEESSNLLSFENFMTRGLSTEASLTLKSARKAIEGHMCSIGGDLSTSCVAWKRYGRKADDDAYTFHPPKYVNPLRVEMRFKEALAYTQLFVGYVEKRRKECLEKEEKRYSHAGTKIANWTYERWKERKHQRAIV